MQEIEIPNFGTSNSVHLALIFALSSSTTKIAISILVSYFFSFEIHSYQANTKNICKTFCGIPLHCIQCPIGHTQTSFSQSFLKIYLTGSKN